jgi:5-methylcytosine-specific restriction endonuclease McrA
MALSARFCSNKCRHLNGRTTEPTERKCATCGTEFSASNNKRFCSARCGKAYWNAKKRGSPDKLLAEPWTPPQPFDCEQCGERCVPGENVAQHASKFCGKECKSAWHRTNEDGARYRWEREQQPKRKRQQRQAQARKRLANPTVGKPRSFIVGKCGADDCDQTFVASTALSAIGHYCSEICNKRQAARRRAERYGWNESNRARARRYGVAYEAIRIKEVFERDDYRCGICGEQTDPEAKVPEPHAPTLDHIVPMSAHGPHTYSNVQCACFRCNSIKGNRFVGDQMVIAA